MEMVEKVMNKGGHFHASALSLINIQPQTNLPLSLSFKFLPSPFISTPPSLSLSLCLSLKMEAVSFFHSFQCTGTFPHVLPILEKPGVVTVYCTTLNKPLSTQRLTICGRPISWPVGRKGSYLSHVEASETTVAVTSDAISSGSSSQGPLEKKILQTTTFPNGFESLVLEVCDETEVAELKLKVGDFEMHMKRNVGATKAPMPPVASPSTAPAIPSKPMVESVSAAPPASPPKSSPATPSPFTNASLAKSSKLASLEGSGTNAYVIVSSPTVGSFRRGRTVKGKKQPPICKEGDVIKEGQVIGYLDQFGNELPVRSDIAGEILKLLYKDGEAVGYGDPLVAVLPSFRGIQ